MKYRAFIIYCFLLLSLFAQRKRMVFEHVGVKDGLSQSSVNCVFHDSRGFMWFGTYDGLNRYDGIRFKIFRHDPNNENSIIGNVIKWIAEDEEERLWIATINGLSRLDRETMKFTNYQFSASSVHSLSNDNVNYVFVDMDGDVWASTANGLSLYRKETDDFKRFCFDSAGDRQTTFYEICQEDSATLWMGTEDRGLLKLNKNTGKMTNLSDKNPKLAFLKKLPIISLLMDGDLLWIGAKGLWTIDTHSLEIRNMRYNYMLFRKFSYNAVNQIYKDRFNKIWIASWGAGLALFDKEKDKFTCYSSSPFDNTTVSHNMINAICEDSSGCLWLATRYGVDKYNQGRRDFIHYVREYENEDIRSLPHNDVTVVYEDRGKKVWLGTQRGLVRFEEKNEEFIPFTDYFPKPVRLKDNIILSMLEDKRGFYWVGTVRGLYQIDKKTKNYKYYHAGNKKNSLRSEGVVSLFEDRFGSVWIGTWSGINRYFPEKDSMAVYYHKQNAPSSVGGNLCWSFMEDRDGDLWLATDDGGLNLYDGKNDSFIRYQFKKDENSISNNRVISLLEAGDGTIWIGTANGLNSYDKETGEFNALTTRDGLVSDAIYALTEDSEGNIWATTNRGLSVYEIFSNQIKNYSIHDGIQDYEFNNNAMARLNDGRIIAAGINGFNLFDPGKIEKNNSVPAVVLTNLKIYNQEVEIGKKYRGRIILDKSLNEMEELVLSFKDDYFVIEFAALHYTAPEYNKFAYILEGVYQEWIQTTQEQAFATFSNLAPGTYRFSVIACNSDGLWNQKGKSIKITINPPFWRTYIFYFAAGIMFFLMVFSLYEWKIYKINRQKKLLEETVNERTEELKRKAEELKDYSMKLEDANRTKNKFFSIIAHDLRNPFTTILTGLEYLSGNYKAMDEKKLNDFYKSIYSSAHRLFDLLNGLLEWANAHSGHVPFEPRHANGVAIAEKTLEDLAHFSEEKGIQIKLSHKGECYIWGDENMLETILRNLIVNGIKFSRENSMVEVAIEERKRYVVFKVIDQGIGISEENIGKLFRMDVNTKEIGYSTEKGSGLGLLLCKEFVEKNNGDIWVESRIGEGSSFIFRLPKA